MSPPQTDMQSKPAPYIIDQLTESGAVKKNSTRKTRIIAGSVIISLLIIAGIVFGAIAYSYRLFYKEEYQAESRFDGDKIPQHIYVDYKNELIYVNNKQKGKVDGVKSLHNYKRKLTALYDETQQKCFIDTLDDDFDEGLKYWSTYKGVDSNADRRSFEYSKDPIKPVVLRKFGGEELATHCNNGNTTAHWLLSTKPYSGVPEDDDQESHSVEKRWVRCRYYWFVYYGRWYLFYRCYYYGK